MPLHISLTDWDGILITAVGFGPFLMVAALVIFLRIREGDDEVDEPRDGSPAE